MVGVWEELEEGKGMVGNDAILFYSLKIDKVKPGAG